MTELVYWEDTYLFVYKEAVVTNIKQDNDKQVVILNKTIFHPQGGGQPSDTGNIISTSDPSHRFNVTGCKLIDGEVHHYGNFKGKEFIIGEEVEQQIDENKRKLYAMLHSAGHLLDSAVKDLGLELVPTKGYHFPESPYVEYAGNIPAPKRNEVRAQLEQKVNELLQQSMPVEVRIVANEHLVAALGGDVPSYINQENPCRVVRMAACACPCGGTHVKSTGDIKPIRIPKITVKKNVVRISYKIESY